MKLLKTLALASLAFGLTVSAGQASTLLGTVTHDYGIGAGKVDPGGLDVLGSDYVLVSDQLPGGDRFYDSLSYAANVDPAASIANMVLTLKYSNVDWGMNLGFGWWGEAWFARLQGTGSGQDDDAFVRLTESNGISTLIITLSSVLDVDGVSVWARTLADSALTFWFSEETSGKDAFKLYSASLKVYGDAAVVPLPAAAPLLLGGLGLLGFIGRRRRKS